MQRKDEHKIYFEENEHVYTCSTGEVFTSVTKTIDKYFSKFDADKIASDIVKYSRAGSRYYGLTKEEIKDIWKEAAALGTRMHAGIETMFNHSCICDELGNRLQYPVLKETAKAISIKPNEARDVISSWPLSTEESEELKLEFSHFHKFICDKLTEKDGIYCFPELRVFSINKQIAGTIDLLLCNEDGKCSIYDWKRTGNLRKSASVMGSEPFNNVPDCNFEHYKLQLNLYRDIIENNYLFNGLNLEVTEMKLFIFHPNNSSYVEEVVPRDLAVEFI